MKFIIISLLSLCSLPAMAESNISCPYNLRLTISDRNQLTVSMPNAKVLSLIARYAKLDHVVSIQNGGLIQTEKLIEIKAVMDHGTSEKSIFVFDLTKFSDGDTLKVSHSLMRGFSVEQVNDLYCDASES